MQRVQDERKEHLMITRGLLGTEPACVGDACSQEVLIISKGSRYFLTWNVRNELREV